MISTAKVIQLFICLFLHQTTTCKCSPATLSRCLSVYSYIKPQLSWAMLWYYAGCLSVYSYIKPQLVVYLCPNSNRCLSVYSYIKPQLRNSFAEKHFVVYLSIPTSNHNTPLFRLLQLLVVYLSIPTSNHNFKEWCLLKVALFICLFLHQTTTSIKQHKRWKELFICLFLHQTTTMRYEES